MTEPIQPQFSRIVEGDEAIRALFSDSVGKISRDVAAAEESCFIRAIVLAGYQPLPREDAEWRKHLTLHHEAPGRKIIAIDGKPKWVIITESPSQPLNKTHEIVTWNYTTRMEEVPYEW